MIFQSQDDKQHKDDALFEKLENSTRVRPDGGFVVLAKPQQRYFQALEKVVMAHDESLTNLDNSTRVRPNGGIVYMVTLNEDIFRHWRKGSRDIWKRLRSLSKLSKK